MKHCYLIIAHDSFRQLRLLLDMLDDVRNDIFVHIDKKVRVVPTLQCKYASLFVLQNIDVRWGDFSQIQTELLLFETAYQKGPYLIYHLLSGVDLPIKSNDYIHRFVAENPGKEFMSFSHEATKEYLEERALSYHFLTKIYRAKRRHRKIRRWIEKIVNSCCSRTIDLELKKGANWVSITHACCGYLLSKKAYILKHFKHTYCCDEIYKHSIIWNSPFRNNIYSGGYMRLIDWSRGAPYVWGQNPETDINLIKSSDSWFVRKIDLEKYEDFVKEVVAMVRLSKR